MIRLGLKGRSIAFSVLLLLSTIGVLSTALIWQNYRDSIRRKIEYAAIHTTAIARAAQPYVLLNDVEALVRLMTTQSSEQAVVLAEVIDTHGKILASFRRAGFVPQIEVDPADPLAGPLGPDAVRIELTSGQLLVVKPIWAGDSDIDLGIVPDERGQQSGAEKTAEAVGFMCLVHDLGRVHAQLRSHIFSSAIISVVVILVGIAATVVMIRQLITPIRDLAETATAIADGDLSKRAGEDAIGEICILARAFNYMAQSLAQHTDNLESQVRQRTIELEAQTDELQNEIAERKRAEQALRASQQRYALAARGANDGLWDWNLRTNAVYFSDRWKSILGYEPAQIGSTIDEWFGRVHPEDLEHLKSQISSHLDGATPHFQSEHRILHKDGTYHLALNRGIAVRDESGKAYRMAGSQSEITDRKRVEQQLLHDAFHDALTGLPNRPLFMDRLGRSINQSKRRSDYMFAVVFLDLDRFKIVNDSLGHLMGDQLLIALARRLEACLRVVDTVARLGGDEFAILLDDIAGIEDAKMVADRIQAELARPFNLNGQEIFTTASIGIALSTSRYDREEEVLRDADVAMYRAKSLGRARYELFDADMHADVVAQLELETGLRGALARQEFRVHYQPILLLQTGRIVGFEALVRWQHPRHGLIYPLDFISVAEETGLIIPMGHWVLNEACRQLSCWQRRFAPDRPWLMSVNLSARQFTEPDLAKTIKTVLTDTGLDPRSLRLEITESMVMENIESAAAILHKLKDMHVGLHLDDFGQGYSSLSYLHNFPIDAIKVDRAFIGGMNVDDQNVEIVRTIIGLADNLKIDVIAEGIETTAQLERLKTLNCRYGQGFLFAKPLPPDALEPILAEGFAVPAVPATPAAT